MNENHALQFFRWVRQFQKNPCRIRVFDEVKYPDGKSIIINDEANFIKNLKFYNGEEKINVYIEGRDKIALGDKNVISSFYIWFEVDAHINDPLQRSIVVEELKDKVLSFLKQNNLKLSLLVFSGAGYHFYLQHKPVFFKTDEDRQQYKNYLLGFRELLTNNNIEADKKVFNLERVTKIPGTHNWTYNEPTKIVELNELSNEEIISNSKILDSLILSESNPIQKNITAPQNELIDNKLALDILKKYKIDLQHKWICEIVAGVVIHPDTGGNSVFMKNAGIALSVLPEDELKVVAVAFTSNIKGRTIQAFYGWVKKALEGNILTVNKKEIDEAINEWHYPLTKYADMNKPKQQDFKIMSLQECFDKGIKQPSWIIENIVTNRGITIIGGASCSYKSWIAMHLALSCATGTMFLGNFETEQCNVLYIDEENGEFTLPNRFAMLNKGYNYNVAFTNIFLSIFNNVKLDTAIGREQLKLLINAVKPRIVVIDSMVRCLEGDENEASDVRMIFENLKLIFEENQELSFVILHHTNKQASNGSMYGLRGSGDFAAFADVVLMFNSNYKGYVNVNVAKNRHVDMTTFNEFAIKINGQEDSITFDYVEKEQGSKDAINAAYKDYLDWIDEQNIKVWETKNFQKKLQTLSHSKDAINKLRNRLIENKEISKLSHGKYEVLNGAISVEKVED